MDLPEGAKDMETVRTLMAGLKAGPASLCHIFLVPSTRSCLLADIDAMLLLTEPDSVFPCLQAPQHYDKAIVLRERLHLFAT